MAELPESRCGHLKKRKSTTGEKETPFYRVHTERALLGEREPRMRNGEGGYWPLETGSAEGKREAERERRGRDRDKRGWGVWNDRTGPHSYS